MNTYPIEQVPLTRGATGYLCNGFIFSKRKDRTDINGESVLRCQNSYKGCKVRAEVSHGNQLKVIGVHNHPEPNVIEPTFKVIL